MKTALLFLLSTLVACNEHVSKSLTGPVKNGQTAAQCEEIKSFTEIAIDQKQIEVVMAELQGREPSTASFWSRLSPETRIALNLHLNRHLRVEEEELVYQAASLFFNDQIHNPGSSYSHRSVVLLYNGDRSAARHGICYRNEKEFRNDKRLKAIDTSKLIRESTLQKSLKCEVSSEEIELRIYQQHVVTLIDDKIFAWSGGQLIRAENEETMTFEGLNPDQETLKLELNKNEKRIDLRLNGKTRSLVGTGSCH